MSANRRALSALLASAALVASGISGLTVAPAASAAAADLVITEIAYGGNAAYTGDTGDGEYVELTNIGDASQDVSGWYFSTSASTTIATPSPTAGQPLAGLADASGTNTVVAPGESVIITDLTPADFRTEWGLKSSVKVVADGASTLKKSGSVYVSNGSTVLDQVSYDLTTPGKGSSAEVSSAHVADQQGVTGSTFAFNGSTSPSNGWTLSAAADSEGSWTSAHNAVGSPAASTLGTSTPVSVRSGGVSISGGSDQSATVGTPFSFTGLSVSGGTGPYTWSAPALAGTGLSIDSSTGAITGTPNSAGPIDVTVTVTDSLSATGTTSFTITVSPGIDPNWANIVINEITSDNADNPQLTTNLPAALNTALGANAADLVELYNKGDQAVDITGWKQVDSAAATNATVFSDRVYNVGGNLITSIPAHGFGVFHSGAGLSSGGDAVKIYLPDGTLVDSVTYTAAQAGYDESDGPSTDDEVYHALVRCGDGAGAANTNSNDNTTSWYTVKVASFGSSNASACDTSTDPDAAIKHFNQQPPTGLPGTCTPSAPSGSDQITVADALTWPTNDGVSSVDNVCAWVTAQDPTGNDMSGLVFSSDGSVLWAAQNKNHVWKLVKSGGKYVPATDNDWGSGKAITFTGSDPTTSQVDSEGLTVGGNGDLFVTSERDNHNNNVSKDEVLEYDPTAAGTTLAPVHQWDLTPDFVPSVIAASGDDANLGFEGVTYVPDSFLTAHGFRDHNLGKTYDPADYPGHGSGLYFVAMEKNGHVYAYALNSDGSYQRIADIDTGIDGTSGIADVQYNADDQGIWTDCDNDCGVVDSLLRIDDSGNFVRVASYQRPAGLPDDNLEGFAVAPASTAVNGKREVVWADDGIYGEGNAWNGDRTGNVPSADWGHALYSGTLPANLVVTQTHTGVASINGSGVFNTQLTADTGTVGTDWDAGATLTYAWTDSSNGNVQLGSPNQPLTISDPSLVGHTVTLTVTGKKTGYADATKTASIVISAGTLTKKTPAINGSAKVGSTVTASVAKWGPGSVALRYQWLANGKRISAATGKSLKLSGALYGKTITVRVTGTKAGYTADSAISSGVKVKAGAITVSTPKITGTAKVGKKLTAKPGTWKAGTARVSFKYQWLANGKPIRSATKPSLTLTKSQRGKKITVEVTGSAAGYTTVTKTSKATKVSK